MVSDIAEKLRTAHAVDLSLGRDYSDLFLDGANEIGRLRAEINNANRAVEVALNERVNQRAAANKEITRLHTLIEEMVAVLNGTRIVLKNRDQSENEARVLAAIVSVLSRAEAAK